MGTVPTRPTYVAGAVLTSTQLNTSGSVTDFLLSVPQCSAYRSGSQSIPNATDTAIQLNAETIDVVQSGDSPSHDTVTNNTRIVCRTPGKYEMTGSIRFDTNVTGVRQAGIRLNGTTFLTKNQQPATTVGGATTDCATPTVVATLSAGDYIELMATQSSGGALGIVGTLETTFLRFKFVAI